MVKMTRLTFCLIHWIFHWAGYQFEKQCVSLLPCPVGWPACPCLQNVTRCRLGQYCFVKTKGSILRRKNGQGFEEYEEVKENKVRQSNFLWFIKSVQLLSRVWLFGTRWPAGCQASVSVTNSRGLLKLISIRSVMPSNHFILCRPLLLCLQSRLWEADILEYNHC